MKTKSARRNLFQHKKKDGMRNINKCFVLILLLSAVFLFFFSSFTLLDLHSEQKRTRRAKLPVRGRKRASYYYSFENSLSYLYNQTPPSSLLSTVCQNNHHHHHHQKQEEAETEEQEVRFLDAEEILSSFETNNNEEQKTNKKKKRSYAVVSLNAPLGSTQEMMRMTRLGEFAFWNKLNFAQRHNYDFFLEDSSSVFLNNDNNNQKRAPNWHKIRIVAKYLEFYDAVLYLDYFDTLIIDPSFSIENLIERAADEEKEEQKKQGNGERRRNGNNNNNNNVDLIMSRDKNGLQSGVFLIRRSDWSRSFLRRLWKVPTEWTQKNLQLQEQGAFQLLLGEKKASRAIFARSSTSSSSSSSLAVKDFFDPTLIEQDQSHTVIFDKKENFFNFVFAAGDRIAFSTNRHQDSNNNNSNNNNNLVALRLLLDNEKQEEEETSLLEASSAESAIIHFARCSPSHNWEHCFVWFKFFYQLSICQEIKFRRRRRDKKERIEIHVPKVENVFDGEAPTKQWSSPNVRDEVKNNAKYLF